MQNTIHASQLKPNIGLSDEQMASASQLLATLLADEVVLRTRLQNYHWNLTGPQFKALHELFEQQYTQLVPVIDEIAERVRQYGYMAPGTLTEFMTLTRLQEQPGVYPSSRGMLQQLLEDQELIVRHLREDVEVADDLDDVSLEDFLTGLLQMHQTMAWMLRAFLEGDSL